MKEELLKSLLTLARNKVYRIVTAESITAGLIASTLAEVSGASDVLLCGFTVYTPEAKSAVLNVSPLLIDRYGVVSEEVAKAMATGALKNAYDFTQSEKLISVAVTGIAGPTGGTKKALVGTVCFAISSFLRDKVIYAETETVNFKGSRNEVRKKTAEMAIKKIIEKLDKI